MKKVPEELDKFVDKILAYDPKKSKKDSPRKQAMEKDVYRGNGNKEK